MSIVHVHTYLTSIDEVCVHIHVHYNSTCTVHVIHTCTCTCNYLLGLNEATQPVVQVCSTGSTVVGDELVLVVLLLMRCIGRRPGW